MHWYTGTHLIKTQGHRNEFYPSKHPLFPCDQNQITFLLIALSIVIERLKK